MPVWTTSSFFPLRGLWHHLGVASRLQNWSPGISRKVWENLSRYLLEIRRDSCFLGLWIRLFSKKMGVLDKSMMSSFFHIRYRVFFMWKNADDLRHQFPELLRSTGIVCKWGATRWRGEVAEFHLQRNHVLQTKRGVYRWYNLVGGFIFLIIFFPWGIWSKLTISYFSNGLVQPPTRNLLGPMTINMLALDEYRMAPWRLPTWKIAPVI